MYSIDFDLDGKHYKSYINLEGNIKEKYFGISYNASLIGFDINNNCIKFGKINKEFFLDYREDESKNKFFQRTLQFSDICEDNIFEPIYYNVIYKYKCNYDLKKNEPIFKVHTDRCRIEIEIFVKEACEYIKLPYDNFLVKYKFIICVYYAFFVIMLIIPSIVLSYVTANTFAMIIILSLITIFFSLNESLIIIPFIISILIGISSIYFLNEKFPSLNKIILMSVTGYTFGVIIMEYIFIYFKILNVVEIWIIIIIFTIAFNLLIFLSLNMIYIICSSFLCSYFISNIYKIWISKKAPIWTIINTLVEEGFNMPLMEKFLYNKYYIYFIIYLIPLLLILILKYSISSIHDTNINSQLIENENTNRNIGNDFINNIDNK